MANATCSPATRSGWLHDSNVALSPGSSLGPYEIQAPLGAGGMGEVYQARDTRLDRTVAIKVLPEHVAAVEELRAHVPVP